MSTSLHKKLRRRACAGLVSVAMLMAGVAQAANIEKQNLFELLSHAESIVVGTVVEKTDGLQDGLPYTEITLQVGQSIKGADDTVVTFRQFGLIKPKATNDGRVNLMVTPAGWPKFNEGEQVMLFLHKPASETGFQTTAGLTQGKFSIRGGEIVNGINNESLFAGVRFTNGLPQNYQDMTQQQSGAFAAEAFISLVREAVENNWIESGVMINAQQ